MITRPPRPVSFSEFVWIWNHRQGQGSPRHHLRMARWLEKQWLKGHRALLLMAFRGSGKSTLVGLFCAWLLCGHPDLRLMVLAADYALAKKMVRNVKRIIERHPLTAHLKPDQRDQWAADQFTVRRPGELRDPSMVARGITGNITGSRADVIVCDDVEVPNTSDSAPKRADLRTRLLETDFILVPGGLQLYVGTPHSYYTIYADQPRPEAGETHAFLDGFERLEIPLLDRRGQSRWPERFPTENIEMLRRRTGANRFNSQMMLRPVNSIHSRLDPERLQLYDAELVYSESNRLAHLTLQDRTMVSVSCWWDPSYGSPGSGDRSVVAAVFTDSDGDYWLHAIRYLTFDPARTDVDEATQLCRHVVAFVQDYHIPSLMLETNGLGRFLPGLLRRELALAQVGCAVVEKTSRQNKDQRILDAFEVPLAAGALHAHRSVWDTPFITEMREWQPSRNSHDDGLDAVAGCLLHQPVRLGHRPTTAPRPNWQGAQVWTVQDAD